MRSFWRRYRPPDAFAVIVGGLVMGSYAFVGGHLGLVAGVYLALYGVIGGVVVGLLSERLDPAFHDGLFAVPVGLVVNFCLSVVDDVVVAGRYPVMPLPWAGPDKIPAGFTARVLTFATWEFYMTVVIWLPLGVLGVLVGAVAGSYARTLVVVPLWDWTRSRIRKVN